MTLDSPPTSPTPPAERQHDLYIQSSSGQWTASDIRKGSAVPYSSSSFVSFRVLGPHQTRITVYGHDAHITDGTRLSVLNGYGLQAPYLVKNTQAVPPSPADKRALLDTLLTLLDQPDGVAPLTRESYDAAISA